VHTIEREGKVLADPADEVTRARVVAGLGAFR
jgi:hypothetical protein